MAGKTFKLSIIVDYAGDKAQKGLAGFGKGLAGLGTAALATGTIAVGALTGIGAGAAKLAIDAAPLEGIQGAFEGIAEASGKSSRDMMAALKRGSAGMIAQRDLMKSYNLAASLVSDTFANQLPDAMGYLTKVSAATGEDMGYMMDSLVRGVGRLSPLILDNLGIQVSLQEAYEAFAPTVGKSVKELTKQEQQMALSNMVMQKLAENTANLPDVTGTAQHGLAAFSVTMQDFKDMVGMALLPALSELLAAFSEIGQEVLPIVADFIIGTLAPAIKEGAVIFREMVASGSEFRTKLGEIVAKIQEVVGPILSAVGQFVSWKDVLIALGIAIAAVVIPAIVSIAQAVGTIIAVAGILIAGIAVLRNAWESDWAGIRTTTTEILGIIAGALGNWIALFQSLWSGHGSTITAVAKLWWDNIKTIFTATISILLSAIKLFLQVITLDWEGASETLKEITDTAMSALATIIQNSLTAIALIFTTTWESIKSFLRSIDLAEIGANIMESLKSGILSKVGEIISAIRDAISNIINTARDAVGAFSYSKVFFQIGGEISTGLAKGIAALSDLPVKEAAEMTRGVIPGRSERMVILAPIFLDPLEYRTPEGDVDYRAVAARLKGLEAAV